MYDELTSSKMTNDMVLKRVPREVYQPFRKMYAKYVCLVSDSYENMTKAAKDGYKAVDIVVQFENDNEEIVTLFSYFNGKIGEKLAPNSVTPDIRVGEKMLMSCLQIARISQYDNWHNTYIEFEDGCTVKCDYQCFITGKVAHPHINASHEILKERYLFRRNFFKGCGQFGTVVNVVSSNNITIRFQDGYEKQTTTLQFRMGQVANDNVNPAKHDGQKMIGEKKLMDCGYVATIREWRNAQSIFVSFDIPGCDNLLSETSYYFFTHGKVPLPKSIRMSGRSMTECYFSEHILPQLFPDCTILCNCRNIIGLEGLEADAYVKDYNLVFEFLGGAWHKERKIIKRDQKKAKLCAQHDITLIRVLDYEAATYQNITNDIIMSSYKSEDKEHAAKELVQLLTDVYGITVQEIDYSYDTFVRKWEVTHPIPLCNSASIHEGIRRETKHGLGLTCIKYRNALDADFEFDDGKKVYHRTWKEFIVDNIAYKTREEFIQDRIGTSYTMKDGFRLTCVEYENYYKATFQYDDGTPSECHSWQQFERGLIKKPKSFASTHEGVRRETKHGIGLTCIKYRNSLDADFEFDDGKKVCHRAWQEFMVDNIAYKTREEFIQDRIGTSYTMKDGFRLTCVEYENYYKATFQYDDGTPSECHSWHQFENRTITKPKPKKNIVGNTYTLKDGTTIIVVDCQNQLAKILYPSGVVRSGVRADHLTSGGISSPKSPCHWNKIPKGNLSHVEDYKGTDLYKEFQCLLKVLEVCNAA